MMTLEQYELAIINLAIRAHGNVNGFEKPFASLHAALIDLDQCLDWAEYRWENLPHERSVN
jgi:hypothetical protein